MAFIIKLGRLAKLLGIAGISLGSVIVSACNGKTKLDGESDLTEEAEDIQQDETAGDVTAEDAAGEDIAADPTEEEAQPEDVPEEEPDTDLWDVICE